MDKLRIRAIFLKQIFRGDLLVQGVKVALVVGTIMVFVNHLTCCINQQINVRHPFQIILCYLVPFLVSIYVGTVRISGQDSN